MQRLNSQNKYIKGLIDSKDPRFANSEKILKDTLITLLNSKKISYQTITHPDDLDQRVCCEILAELHANNEFHDILDAVGIKSVTQFSKYFYITGYERHAPTKIIALVNWLGINKDDLRHGIKYFNIAANNKYSRSNIDDETNQQDPNNLTLEIFKNEIQYPSPKVANSQKLEDNSSLKFIEQIEKNGSLNITTNVLENYLTTQQDAMSNHMLARLERALNSSPELKSRVRKLMRIRLQEILNHEQYQYLQNVRSNIINCFTENMTTLSLGCDRLKNLPPNDLLILLSNHVTYFNFMGNQISEIKNEFTGMINLKIISLFNNKITKIAEDAFIDLINLKELNLSNNPLEKLPDFRPLVNLEELNLEKITNDPNFDFSRINDLTKLTQLNLSDNQLTDFRIELKNPHTLDRVILDKNPLNKLSPEVFNKYSFLGVISLKKCSQEISDAIKNNYPKDLHKQITITINNMMIIGISLVPPDVFNSYLNNQDINQVVEQYCLGLLLKNKLQEPEVKRKLVTRLFSGKIDVRKTHQDLTFFVKLAPLTEISLLCLLNNNLDYFTASEQRKAEVAQVLAYALLVKPLQLAEIDNFVKKNFINKIQQLHSDVNQNVVEQNIIRPLKLNQIKAKINTEVRETVFNKILENLTQIEPSLKTQKIIDQLKQLNKEQVAKLVNYKQNLALNSTRMIKICLNNLIGNEDQSEENLSNQLIQKLAKYIFEINISEIEQVIIKRYGELLGISNDLHDKFYNIFIEYLNWNQVIDAAKQESLLTIRNYIMETEPKFRHFIIDNTQNDEIYTGYILNVLPYLTPSDVINIMDNNIPLRLTAALKLVLEYIEDNNLLGDEYANKPLNLFVIKEKTTDKNQLLMAKDLYFLNNMTHFELNDLTLLKKEAGKTEWQGGDKITLAKIEELILPNFLLEIINKNFTTASIVAENINKFLNQLIKFKKISLTKEELTDLHVICHNAVLNLNKTSLKIDEEFRKRLMYAFRDEPGMTKEPENDEYNIQVAYAKMRTIDIKNSLTAEKYSTLIINTANSSKITPIIPFNNLQELSTNIYHEILDNKLSIPANNLTQPNINYLLGTIFLNMSSIDVLGYHIQQRDEKSNKISDDNKAFTWFRLLGALCLAQTLLAKENNWNIFAKQELNAIIHDIINTDLCSGVIVNRLYSSSVSANLRPVYEQVKSTLETKLNYEKK